MTKAVATVLLAFAALTGCAHVTVSTSASDAGLAAKKALKRAHHGETSFYGTVTSYKKRADDYWCEDEHCVHVDGATVNLDMIDPYGAACMDTVEDKLEAERAKRELLPLGTRVWVALSNPKSNINGRSGFIHLAAERSEHSVSGSVNERLVRSGYWVPEESRYNTMDVANPYANTRSFALGDNVTVEWFTRTQAPYIPLILKAANSAWGATAGGLKTCVQQTKDYDAEQVKIKQNWDRTNRKVDVWWKKWTRAHPDFFRCRDGDGDGVCNER